MDFALFMKTFVIFLCFVTLTCTFGKEIPKLQSIIKLASLGVANSYVAPP